MFCHVRRRRAPDAQCIGGIDRILVAGAHMKRICLTALVLAGACLGAFSAYAQEATRLRFATVASGAVWTAYSAGMIDMIAPRLPAGLSIETESVAGALASISLLQAGKAEIGFSFANTSSEACSGTGSFTSRHDKLRALLGGLDAHYLVAFMTRKSGVKSWEEIAEPKSKFWLLTLRTELAGEQG